MIKKILFFVCIILFQQSIFSSMVENGNFESGGETLDNWKFNLGDGRRAAIPAGTNGVSNNGINVFWDEEDENKSLMLTTDANNIYALVISDPIPLVAGWKYKITFKYRAEGLMHENGDRTQHAAAMMDFFIEHPEKRRVASSRIITFNNSKGWATLSRNNQHTDYFTVPQIPDCYGQVRLQLANRYPNNSVKIWYDDVVLEPVDMELPNASFENGDTSPTSWNSTGAAKATRVISPTKSGKYSLAVSDAPDGLFSGWMTEVPVNPSRKYTLSGFIKGGDLNPNGFIGGGALAIEFLNKHGEVIGDPVVSKAVPANTDWTKVETVTVQPPRNAITAKIIAGLKYCNGTAWFDDLSLTSEKAKLKDMVMVKRPSPKQSSSVAYSKNLLANGDIEAGAGETPDNWTFIGKSDKDWTEKEIQAFHDNGRPEFDIGRAKGAWSSSSRYEGKHSLNIQCIDPPLSPNHQWYGRNPVDGYWLSDAMPCEPGKAYMAGGWINPGAKIISPWYGPLLLVFYDDRGNVLEYQNNTRSGLNNTPAGQWTYWASQPQIAPTKAVSMKLKFAQELQADKGGWGRIYADNIAVWQVVPDAKVTGIPSLNNRGYRQWFTETHKEVKPPYISSPAIAEEYESVWGRVENTVTGNLFSDPNSSITLKFKLFNLLGENRKLKVTAIRTDWLGEKEVTVESSQVNVKGYSEETLKLVMPPTDSFGAFHLDVTIKEGDATVGSFSARYGILPKLDRPRTVEAIWGVTPLGELLMDGNPYEQELGEVMEIAGFGKAWVRLYLNHNSSTYNNAYALEKMRKTKLEVDWYRSLGITPVLQVNPPRLPQTYPRTVDTNMYYELGQLLAQEFDGSVAAIGNWGIEQANSGSPYRGGGNLRITDLEYDTMLVCIYDGIKSVAPELPVLIGNIATDFNADTIERLYKAPANGRFEGAIFNAYMGQLMVGENMLKAFDRHGNTDYTIWSEEQANQRSPYTGDARRYGESEGPKNMVRTWLSMTGKLSPRIKAITMWGFAPNTAQDIMMMTPDLQPRPQYNAHAVMADALADATFVENLSTTDTTILKWERGDGDFFAAWANSGKRSITLEISNDTLTVMDLMGNRQELKSNNGLITLELTSMPIYFFGGGKTEISKRIGITISNATVDSGKPLIDVTVQNNGKDAVNGTLNVSGLGEDAEAPLSLKPGQNKTVTFPVAKELPYDKRSSFRAEMTLESGAAFASIGEFVFAQAAKVKTPPSLDGTWNDWKSAQPIEFGYPDQVITKKVVGESFTGKNDLYGKIRLMWDEDYLYLGVESLDDIYVPNPTRGMHGFMGDSIEFGIQPEHILSESAPKYEFELYQPDDKYGASRRFPMPAGMIDHWNATVTPTGEKGNVNYQVAIPWKDLDVTAPTTGKQIGLSIVLNDKDNIEAKFGGARNMISWFNGVHTAKSPEKYGDIILVDEE